MLPQRLIEFIQTQSWGKIREARPLGGGCINDARLLTTTGGPPIFLKQNHSLPPDTFPREADGLRELAKIFGAPRVPLVFLEDAGFLLLEYLEPEPAHPLRWEIFGAELATLHLATAPQYGFHADNYLGATPQPNPWTENGHQFFIRQRLRYQAQLARRNGLLSAETERQIERLGLRLTELIPPQPPSLLHGDLWSGNIHTGPGGKACLIDPAAHYGWAETDLAMANLFGSLPPGFYAAYEAIRPLEPGYRQRFDIYNLYHLLNHLNLFGPGYLAQIEATLSRYC
jgi:protein-ribulosamine 3-kinase